MNESKKTSSIQATPPNTDQAELTEDDLAQVSGGTKPSGPAPDATANRAKASDAAVKQMNDYIRS
jgi:bacteriocin-like protein